MEPWEKEQLEKHAEKDEELKSVYTAHQGYEKQIADLEKKSYLSPQESLEKKRLKKLKLAQKDSLQRLLVKYR